VRAYPARRPGHPFDVTTVLLDELSLLTLPRLYFLFFLSPTCRPLSAYGALYYYVSGWLVGRVYNERSVWRVGWLVDELVCWCRCGHSLAQCLHRTIKYVSAPTDDTDDND
jgi:hypothetical protein